MLIATITVAQTHTESPLKSYKDFELSKPVKYVKIASYEVTENSWEPVMTQVISFNESNQLIQEYMRILGSLGSETAYNYVYNGKKLDSVNILASAPNFNIKGKVQTDKSGRILNEKATGYYVDYNRVYTYNKDGTTKTITTSHTSGNHNWTAFFYKKGALDLITQVDGAVYKSSVKNYFLYHNGSLFASWNDLDNIITLMPTAYRHYRLVANPAPLVFTKELRALYDTNKKAFDTKMLELSKDATIVYQQGTSSNEQGDWTKKMTVTVGYGLPSKRFLFREIVYADGTTSGSTDFDSFFYRRMKDL
jgi:hypothetical protein